MRSPSFVVLASLLAPALLPGSALLPGRAEAQLRRATSPTWQPAVSIAAPDDALAVSVDPAAMAYLRGWSAVYVHAEADESLSLAERGDGLYAAPTAI